VVYGDIDGRGQPLETTVPGISATMGMEPDAEGAPVSVSPPGQPAHGFEYSVIGQATEYRPPGVAEVPNPADCPLGATCTVYDTARRVDEVVQADAQVLDMHYNQATGQLTSVDVPDDGTYTFTYSPTTGNVDTVTGPAGTTALQTLWQSDLPIASIATGPVPGRVDVTYNNFIETERLEVTGGHGVRYSELCRHGDHDYAYDANGRLLTRANVSDPLDETVYTYDGGGRLHRVAHGSTTVDYVHDALGRRVGRVLNGVFERGWLYKDSLNPIAQVDAAGNVEATYVLASRLAS